MTDTFKALQASETDGKVALAFTDLTIDDLPDGDVTIDVAYSTLNYKDGMALNGNKGRIMRGFPMVPGIDLSGTVTRSQSPDYQVGDRVLINGWGLGETASGGFAQKARVKSEWLVKVPDAFDLALNVSTSLGYFEDPADDRQVLENVYASLAPGAAS